MTDYETIQRQAFCRRAMRYNGCIRRGVVLFCAAFGAGVVLGQIIGLILHFGCAK